MHEPALYQIRVKGHLGARWAAWFDGLAVTPDLDGTTLLCGILTDQAALHGILARIRDLGLPLVALEQLREETGAEEMHPGKP